MPGKCGETEGMGSPSQIRLGLSVEIDILCVKRLQQVIGRVAHRDLKDAVQCGRDSQTIILDTVIGG